MDLMDATNRAMEAILPSDHAKRYRPTEREREALREELRQRAGEAIEALASVIRYPNISRMEAQRAVELSEQVRDISRELDK